MPSLVAVTLQRCTGLTSVVIGDSVETIGESAFQGCSSLKDVYYTGSEEQWTALLNNIGSNNSALTGAEIHCNYNPNEE